MTFDPATKALSGRYCERCGRQEFDRDTHECVICGGSLFQWRAPRRRKRRDDGEVKPEPKPKTLSELLNEPAEPTDKQKFLLAKYGQPIPATKQEASKLLLGIAKNGWNA